MTAKEEQQLLEVKDSCLTKARKKRFNDYVMRGADSALLAFWNNLELTSTYHYLEPRFVIRLVEERKRQYPKFASDIDGWFESFKVVYARENYLKLQ